MSARLVKSDIILFTAKLNGVMELRVNTLDNGWITSEYRLVSWGVNGTWYKFHRAKNLQTIVDKFEREFIAVKQ